MMSWERDYSLNGRPTQTGLNFFTGRWEYGSMDEDRGVSFASALRGSGIQVAEGVEIVGQKTSVDTLLAGNVLVFGPQAPEDALQA